MVCKERPLMLDRASFDCESFVYVSWNRLKTIFCLIESKNILERKTKKIFWLFHDTLHNSLENFERVQRKRQLKRPVTDANLICHIRFYGQFSKLQNFLILMTLLCDSSHKLTSYLNLWWNQQNRPNYDCWCFYFHLMFNSFTNFI